ncbi:MAG: hypothetical protein ACO4B3_11605 [Planctomycetota bacterium]
MHRDSDRPTPHRASLVRGSLGVALLVLGLLALPAGRPLLGLPSTADEPLRGRLLQFDPTLSGGDIEWECALPAETISVERAGGVIGRADVADGYLTDEAPGFGVHRYRVTAHGPDAPLATAEATITVLPAPLGGVYCTQPDPLTRTVVVEWSLPMEYDSLRVRHRDELIHTLPGRATRVVCPDLPRGRAMISVTGVVAGVESLPDSCRSNLTEPPSHRFTLRAADTVATYDPATGVATVQVRITAREEGAQPGEGTPVQGMQVGAGHDGSVMTPREISPGSALSSPDFFDGQLLPDGITVGAVLDFKGGTTIDLSTEKEVVVATYSVTVPEELRGGELELPIGFRNGLGTGPPIDSSVVVEGRSVRPTLINGTLTLRPAGGAPFRRGDTDGSGVLDLEDVGELIANLLEPEAARPLDDCLDASDLDDSGTIDIVDLGLLVSRIFGESPPPPAPGDRDCGLDPTTDDLPCRRSAACAE